MTGEDVVEPVVPVGGTGKRGKLNPLIGKDVTMFQQQFVSVLQVATVQIERQYEASFIQIDRGGAGSTVQLPGEMPAIVLPLSLAENENSRDRHRDQHRDREAVADR